VNHANRKGKGKFHLGTNRAVKKELQNQYRILKEFNKNKGEKND